MNDYDEIDDLALQVRMDYGFLDKRVDVFKLLEKLHVHLVKYSQLTEDQRKLIEEQCSVKDAMTIFDNSKFPSSCYLLYNDSQPLTRIRFSTVHEAKHILCGERNPTARQEQLADHFSRAFLVPSCLLIYEEYDTFIKAASDFDISFESAYYALKSAIKRKNSPRFRYSDTEKEFLRWYEENRRK